MDPIKEFTAALWAFRKISKELLPDRKRRGPRTFGSVREFNNLEEFKDYHKKHYKNGQRRGEYIKKTDKVYKKSSIPQKITIDRKKDPKGWDKQYQWFKNNPDADVYAPRRSGNHRCGGRPKSDISKKINVERQENPHEYDRQYMWFRKHPEAQVYAPRPWGRNRINDPTS
jgi:hypothetical protein